MLFDWVSGSSKRSISKPLFTATSKRSQICRSYVKILVKWFVQNTTLTSLLDYLRLNSSWELVSGDDCRRMMLWKWHQRRKVFVWRWQKPAHNGWSCGLLLIRWAVAVIFLNRLIAGMANNISHSAALETACFYNFDWGCPQAVGRMNDRATSPFAHILQHWVQFVFTYGNLGKPDFAVTTGTELLGVAGFRPLPKSWTLWIPLFEIFL